MSKLQNKVSNPKPNSKITQKDQKGSKGFQNLEIKKSEDKKGYIMKVIKLYA